MPCQTKRPWIGKILLSVVLFSCVWLWACAEPSAPLVATLTFRKDGSRFTGTVLRKDTSSITVLSNNTGDPHTFLYTELADISYGGSDGATSFAGPASTAAAESTAAGDKTASSGLKVAAVSSGTAIQLPEGTELPVRNNGVLDACCLPMDSIALGVMDADVKNAEGRVLVPEGANVTLLVRDKKMVDGRVTMTFELGSADFDNRHYLISSAKGNLAPGAVVTFSGPQEGTPEAKLRGLWLHLDDRTYMGFKTATPTIFKLSK